MGVLSSNRPRNNSRSGRRDRRGPRPKNAPARQLAGVALPAEPYWIPGERAVTELLSGASSRVLRVFLRDGKQADAVEELAERHQIPVTRYQREQLDNVIDPALARGVLGLARAPALLSCEDLVEAGKSNERSLLLALDGVQDPQNLGALMRSAEFFGCDGMFWAKDRAAKLGPTVVRASAGASERVRLCSTVNLARALEICKQEGYWVVGTVADADAPSLFEVIAKGLPEKLVVVMGSEERGLRRLTRERCDFVATIPRKGAVASLNVSAAASVVLSAVAWRPE